MFFFFFSNTATSEIYTLSLHDALPILRRGHVDHRVGPAREAPLEAEIERLERAPVALVDRKSTRLNSSHGYISYAVFCLKKKNPGARPRQPATSPCRHARPQ